MTVLVQCSDVSEGIEVLCGLSLGSSWPERWQRSADGPPAGDLQSAAWTSPPPTANHRAVLTQGGLRLRCVMCSFTVCSQKTVSIAALP